MESELDTAGPSRGDRARARAYLLDFTPAMAAYVVCIVAVVRGLCRSDEYAQLLQFRALAVGFAVGMVGCVVVGMLALAGLHLTATPWIVFRAGMLSWAVAAAVIARR